MTAPYHRSSQRSAWQPSPTSRILEALEDHAMLEVIAAAAGLSQLQTLRILQGMAERGTVRQFAPDCWELTCR